MAKYNIRIQAVPTGGPYSYAILKDDVGLKAAVGLANIGAALDGVKADIAANLAGETVSLVMMQVVSG